MNFLREIRPNIYTWGAAVDMNSRAFREELENELNDAAVVIPDGVTYIPNFCFADLSIKSVAIPSSVEGIGHDAFTGSSVRRVYIKDLAAWCNINFSPDSNPLKQASLYLGNQEISSLRIPEGVTEIKQRAFIGSSIRDVVIPNTVEEIGWGAFRDCEGLERVVIPPSVQRIAAAAFATVAAFERVEIEDLAAWCTIDFAHQSANPLYAADDLYLNKKKVINLIIPNGTPSIGKYAFMALMSIKNIRIPASVKKIGDCAFLHCSGVKTIVIEGVPDFGVNVFSRCNASLEEVYVKDPGVIPRLVTTSDFDIAKYVRVF